MFGWLRRRLWGSRLSCPWTVTIEDGIIVTSDGQGDVRRAANAELRQIVVATDDSGPFDYDVVFLLYASATEPVGVFPLEAEGRDMFVKWLLGLPGARERQLAEAMGSTQVARLVVWSVDG